MSDESAQAAIRAAIRANPELRAKARQIVMLRRWQEQHAAGASLHERVLARLAKLRIQLHRLLRRERERLQQQGGAPDDSDPDHGGGVMSKKLEPERRETVARLIVEPGRGARTRVRYCTPGSRAKREVPLTSEALWLTPHRPPLLAASVPDNECGLCHCVKSHPVRYKCGHSHCYVCIRVWLEHSWECPDYFCGLTMREQPCADFSEEARIAETETENEEELREKARQRMARYRARIKAEEGLAEQARVRAREASKKYRQTHAAQLAHRQRIVRMEAYERKHGHRAWLARYEKLQAQRAEAQELQEMRRHEEEFRRIDEEAERRRRAEGRA
ncbi:hypothetical protein DFH06DRAFT_1329212 [Mycena polygramma]|nr:hypothetical protein DFH06DRAFT_1329212 [Mycena polygramma]